MAYDVRARRRNDGWVDVARAERVLQHRIEPT